MNDPRLPYKDDVFDDEPHIGNPNDDLLEKVEEMSEELQTEPWKIRWSFDSLGSGRKGEGLIFQLASVLQINPKKKTDARLTEALAEFRRLKNKEICPSASGIKTRALPIDQV